MSNEYYRLFFIEYDSIAESLGIKLFPLKQTTYFTNASSKDHFGFLCNHVTAKSLMGLARKALKQVPLFKQHKEEVHDSVLCITSLFPPSL